MVLASESFKASAYRIVLLSAMLALLSNCALITDVKQMIAPPDSALLIRQEGQKNTLTVPFADEKFTHFKSVPVDPKRIPARPSNSAAIEKSAGNTSSPSISASVPSPEMSVEQAKKTLIRYLSMVEDQPESIEKIVVQAEQLVQRYPDDSILQSLWQRLSRYSEWQPVNSIINSAGIDMVSFNGWQPESPYIRIRRALLPPIAENEQIVFGDQRLVLIMVNLATISLKVDAQLEDSPFLPQSPVVMLYQIDDNPPRQLALADQEDWRHVTLTIPPGEHAVRFYQEQSVGNQYIKLRFVESGGELAVAQERPYFISTAIQPLEFYAQGPSVLRIDELDEGNISYRYQNVPEGWHTIRLPPPKNKPRSLLRVSQRVVNLQPTPPNNRVIKRALKPVADPEVIPQSPIISDKVELIDAYKLGMQEDGILSAGLSFVRRNNLQESEGLPEEQFQQNKVNYRYFDEINNAYWNSQGLFRIREHGGPTFGLEESVYYNPDWLPFNVRGSAKVFAQVPHDRIEALGQVNLSLSQSYNLHPKLRLTPNLSFFGRTMSLKNTGRDSNLKSEIDQDVFTPYKAQHTAGLNSFLTLEARPWLDTVWSGKIGLGTNEDFDITLPDHYSTEAHWQQLLGSVALDASYRISFYQPDADRNNASKRSFAGMELNWQHWTAHQHRLELATQYTYDIERKAHLATLLFTWHFGEGRGLRDFAPGEIDFRDIRQRQFVEGDNNVIRDLAP
jgi:hypothetical protein